MLFYKVLILFWGCTRTYSHVWWFENHIIFHIIYIITTPFSPAWHKRLDQFRIWWRPTFRKKTCVVIGWLSQCVVIGEQLRRRFSIAPPLARTASSSILPYQFRPREYWTRGSCRTFACTDIARHIKVVMLLFFLGINQVLDGMSTTA